MSTSIALHRAQSFHHTNGLRSGIVRNDADLCIFDLAAEGVTPAR